MEIILREQRRSPQIIYVTFDKKVAASNNSIDSTIKKNKQHNCTIVKRTVMSK